MESSPIQQQLIRWYTNPIVADIREVRRLATHHHYLKKPARPHVLEVQKPGNRKPYPGSRELASYGEAAAGHLHRFDGLLAIIEDLLQA